MPSTSLRRSSLSHKRGDHVPRGSSLRHAFAPSAAGGGAAAYHQHRLQQQQQQHDSNLVDDDRSAVACKKNANAKGASSSSPSAGASLLPESPAITILEVKHQRKKMHNPYSWTQPTRQVTVTRTTTTMTTPLDSDDEGLSGQKAKHSRRTATTTTTTSSAAPTTPTTTSSSSTMIASACSSVNSALMALYEPQYFFGNNNDDSNNYGGGGDDDDGFTQLAAQQQHQQQQDYQLGELQQGERQLFEQQQQVLQQQYKSQVFDNILGSCFRVSVHANLFDLQRMHQRGLISSSAGLIIPYPTKDVFDRYVCGVVGARRAAAMCDDEHDSQQQPQQVHGATNVQRLPSRRGPASIPHSQIFIGLLPKRATVEQIVFVVTMLTGTTVLGARFIRKGGTDAAAAIVDVPPEDALRCVTRLNRRVLLDEKCLVFASSQDEMRVLNDYATRVLYREEQARLQARPHQLLTCSLSKFSIDQLAQQQDRLFCADRGGQRGNCKNDTADASTARQEAAIAAALENAACWAPGCACAKCLAFLDEHAAAGDERENLLAEYINVLVDSVPPCTRFDLDTDLIPVHATPPLLGAHGRFVEPFVQLYERQLRTHQRMIAEKWPFFQAAACAATLTYETGGAALAMPEPIPCERPHAQQHDASARVRAASVY